MTQETVTTLRRKLMTEEKYTNTYIKLLHEAERERDRLRRELEALRAECDDRAAELEGEGWDYSDSPTRAAHHEVVVVRDRIDAILRGESCSDSIICDVADVDAALAAIRR